MENIKSTKRSAAEKKEIKNRLNRMRGQLEGIIRMVDDDRYTNDIMIQLTAINSASRKIIEILLEHHLSEVVATELKKGRKEAIEEVIELTKRL